MRAYIATTSVLFGLLTVAHIWRIFAESATLAGDPWFVMTTVVTALLCLWGARLYLAGRRQAETRTS